MKHTTFYSSLIFLSFVLFFTSCKNLEEKEVEYKTLTIVAENAQSGTKTQVDYNDLSDGGVGILWSVDDVIGVFGTDLVNVPFSASIAEPQASAPFSATVPATAVPMYAYYPYSTESFDGSHIITDPTNVVVYLDLAQNFTNRSSALYSDPKVSTSVEAMPDGSYRFQFKNLSSLLHIQINPFNTTLVSEQDLLSRVVIAQTNFLDDNESNPNQRILGGNFIVDLTSLNPVLTPAEGDGTSTIGEITIDFSTVTETEKLILSALDGMTEAFINLAPALKAGDKLWVSLELYRPDMLSFKQIVFPITVKQDFEAGKVYYFDINLAELEASGNYTLYEENLVAGDLVSATPPYYFLAEDISSTVSPFYFSIGDTKYPADVVVSTAWNNISVTLENVTDYSNLAVNYQVVDSNGNIIDPAEYVVEAYDGDVKLSENLKSGDTMPYIANCNTIALSIIPIEYINDVENNYAEITGYTLQITQK